MNMAMRANSVVKIAALGDLMLTGEWQQSSDTVIKRHLAKELCTALAEHDVVFANMETALIGSEGEIKKEPRVIGDSPSLQAWLRALRVNLVTLANNHSFDGLVDGFVRLRALLDAQSVGYFGAGDEPGQARRPLVLESNGVRLGWLGYASADTQPSHVAVAAAAGVNLLDEEAILADVGSLKQSVDHVLVSLHWGVEFCHVPSPAQIYLARKIVDAGARLIIGHHAHVVQGVEHYRGGVIAYNLGNLTTTDFKIGGRLAIRQSRRTRSSLLLSVKLSKSEVLDVASIPVRAEDGRLLLHDVYAARIFRRASEELARGVTETGWRRRRFVEDVLWRSCWKLHPAVLRSVRGRHLAKVFRNTVRAARGLGPA